MSIFIRFEGWGTKGTKGTKGTSGYLAERQYLKQTADEPQDVLTSMTVGSRYGSRAGCLSSVLLITLILGIPSLIGILREGPVDWSIYLFMAIYAGVLGVLPAAVVGSIVGAIMGGAFYRLKDSLQTIWHARFVGGLVGLVVIFPAVVAWLDFLFSPRGTIASPLGSFPEATVTGVAVAYLALVVPCVAPGIYVGGRLWQRLEEQE